MAYSRSKSRTAEIVENNDAKLDSSEESENATEQQVRHKYANTHQCIYRHNLNLHLDILCFLQAHYDTRKQMNRKLPSHNAEAQVERCNPQDREYNDWMRSAKHNGGIPKV